MNMKTRKNINRAFGRTASDSSFSSPRFRRGGKENPGFARAKARQKQKSPALAERARTGIDGLDKMLHGGLIRGRNTLLSGPCGSGKTTLAVQFVYNGIIKDGEPGLYVTLEENKHKIMDDMLKLGLDLRTAEKSGKFHIIGGPMGHLTSQMAKVDAKMKDLVAEIEEVVKANKIKRVAVDSINLFTMLAKDDSERRIALAELGNCLSSLGCTSLLLSETKENTMDLSRYGLEEFIVDGVIVLYLVRQDSAFVPGLVVRKIRGSSHDREIRVYQITDKGIVVYPDERMFTG